jgi:hypothetical protein
VSSLDTVGELTTEPIESFQLTLPVGLIDRSEPCAPTVAPQPTITEPFEAIAGEEIVASGNASDQSWMLVEAANEIRDNPSNRKIPQVRTRSITQLWGFSADPASANTAGCPSFPTMPLLSVPGDKT